MGRFIKQTIQEFLNENKTDIFNKDEKEILISIYRNRLFDKVRGSDLYKKYNGSTIPMGEFSEGSWKLLLQGIKESGLNVYEVLDKKIKILQKQINTPISQEFKPSVDFLDQEEKKEFNPLTGEFCFIDQEEKRIEKERPISQEFNPSTGEFLGFIDQEEKKQTINKTKNDIELVKKFVNYLG